MPNYVPKNIKEEVVRQIVANNNFIFSYVLRRTLHTTVRLYKIINENTL